MSKVSRSERPQSDATAIPDDILRPWVKTPALDEKVSAETYNLKQTRTKASLCGRTDLSSIDLIPEEIAQLRNSVGRPSWFVDPGTNANYSEETETDGGPETEFSQDIEDNQEEEENRSETVTAIKLVSQSSRPPGVLRRKRKKGKKRVRGASFMSNPRIKAYFDETIDTQIRSLLEENGSYDASAQTSSPSRKGSEEEPPELNIQLEIEDSLLPQPQKYPNENTLNSLLSPTTSKEVTLSNSNRSNNPLAKSLNSLLNSGSNNNENQNSNPTMITNNLLPALGQNISSNKSKPLFQLNPSTASGVAGSTSTAISSANSVAMSAMTSGLLSSRPRTTGSLAMHNHNPVSARFEASSLPPTAALGKISISGRQATNVPIATASTAASTVASSSTVASLQASTDLRLASMRESLNQKTKKHYFISKKDNQRANDLLDKDLVKQNIAWAKETQDKNKMDHAWSLLQTKGFFEAVGPSRIYQSELSFGHHMNQDFVDKLMADRDQTYCMKKNEIRAWHENAIRNHVDVFPKGDSLK